MNTVGQGASGQAGDAEVAAALSGGCDLLVLSAEIPVGTLAAVLAGARAAGVRCLLNLAPAPGEPAALLAGGLDWLGLDQAEAPPGLGARVGPPARAGAPRP